MSSFLVNGSSQSSNNAFWLEIKQGGYENISVSTLPYVFYNQKHIF